MPSYRKFSSIFATAALFLVFGASAEAAAVPAKADELTVLFGLPITNSMVTSWVISILLVVAVRIVLRKPTMIPHRGQSFLEGVVEMIQNMIAPIVGKHMVRAVFPFLVSLFIFIIIHNWSGMLPGVGTIGWGTTVDGKFTIVEKLIRPGNTDLNTTLALALVAIGAWLFYSIRYAGFGVLAHDIFGNKASKRETPPIIYWGLAPIFLLVGVIEMVSIAFRPVSLSLRLYGNMFGGENLLMSMSDFIAWIVPIPFYFFEVMVGLIQAFIFTILVAIYIGLICNHGEEAGH